MKKRLIALLILTSIAVGIVGTTNAWAPKRYRNHNTEQTP